MSDIEDKINKELAEVCARSKTEVDYTPSRFLEMMSRDGGIVAAKKVISCNNTDGFDRLWLENRLDLSVEAIVIKPEYSSLFTEDERQICLKRLCEAGFQPQA